MLRFLIIILISNYSHSQFIKYEKGEIIDSVYVGFSKNESFSLYLPQKYNINKLSPVIFIFDPMANGKNAISNFLKVSDKYGHILVSSNNTRNASYKANFDITNRLFDKVFSSFNIDPKRIYTSGFSGGARLASTIAVLTKQIQGVVACGAGFSFNPEHTPYENTFSFVGIIGDLDMNYNEMYETTYFLSKLKIPHRLFVHNIKHRWPFPDQLLEAFDWLQLEAYRKNIIKKNNENIYNLYRTFYDKAKKQEVNNNLIYALRNYEQIIKDFNHYITTDSIKDKVKFLKKNKTLRKQSKLLELAFKKEKKLTEKFKNQFSIDLIKPNNEKIIWWKKEIKLLKKNKLSSSNTYDKKMYDRLLYKIFALAIETVTIGNSIKNVDQSILCFDICLAIYPKYYKLYFIQAENYINKNLPDKAVDLIELLLNSDYLDKESIVNYKGFNTLKRNTRFISLTKQ